MNELGIDYPVLPVPHLPGVGEGDATATARRTNERLAEVVALRHRTGHRRHGDDG